MRIDAANLVWIDLEMTGLDTVNDAILEIATIVTDAQLREMQFGPTLQIYQPEAVLGKMDAWNTRQHGASALLEKVRKSTLKYAEAEAETLCFLKLWAVSGRSPMCGNSICQDRRFLDRLMPDLCAFFHYRNLDVSTLKEMAKRWAPEVANGFVKSSTHLAADDVLESIQELKYYRKHLLKC